MDYYNLNKNVQKPEEVFIHGISGLRALGIFGVILYHMHPLYVKGGFLGVTLFFMISGYLLAVKTVEQRSVTSFSVPDFYLKRIKRLYPQLIVVLLTTAGLMKLLLPHGLRGIKVEILSILFGFNNIWQISQNASYFERIANSSPFTHMWSLSNEIQLYLIWPLLFFLFLYLIKVFDTKKAVRAFGILAILTAFIMPIMYLATSANPGFNLTRLYYGTDTRIFSFLTGAYIGFMRTKYRRHNRIRNTKPYVAGFLGLLALIFISYGLMDGEAAFTYIAGMFLVNIVFGLMIMLTTDTRLPIGEFLEGPVFTFFGNVSYEMYLWMYPVIYIFHSFGWQKHPGSTLIMLLIIVGLAHWLNAFSKSLVRLKIDLSGDLVKRMKTAGVIMLTVPALIFSILGTGGIITAPPKDISSRIEMENELSENAQKLEALRQEQLAKKEEETSTESTSTQTQSKSEVPEDNPPVEEVVEEPMTLTAIGDSVMLGAAFALKDTFPDCVVDAAESRQVAATKSILEELDAQNNLGNTILLALGTNGPFSESVGQGIIDYLGPDRKIYWVNVFATSVMWMEDSNRMIQTLADKNPNVTVIDWATEGPNHPEWFYDDGIHLRPEGQSGYAAFVQSKIN